MKRSDIHEGEEYAVLVLDNGEPSVRNMGLARVKIVDKARKITGTRYGSAVEKTGYAGEVVEEITLAARHYWAGSGERTFLAGEEIVTETGREIVCKWDEYAPLVEQDRAAKKAHAEREAAEEIRFQAIRARLVSLGIDDFDEQDEAEDEDEAAKFVPFYDRTTPAFRRKSGYYSHRDVENGVEFNLAGAETFLDLVDGMTNVETVARPGLGKPKTVQAGYVAVGARLAWDGREWTVDSYGSGSVRLSSGAVSETVNRETLVIPLLAGEKVVDGVVLYSDEWLDETNGGSSDAA